jgi:hypothetical protein
MMLALPAFLQAPALARQLKRRCARVAGAHSSKEKNMTAEYEPISEATAVANKKREANVTSPSWHANLHANVPSAINYANADPFSQAGTIVFNIRDNGQVGTYDLH